MALEDLISDAPKSLRPAIWTIAAVITVATLGGLGLSAIDNKAQLAAAQETAPIKENIAELKAGQAQLWSVVNSKLDTISNQLAQTRQDVAVLSATTAERKSNSK